ncbi:MAG: PAS domain S-box protein [Burkholderiales bacterium]|nr:PAS domain S-box protein [Burkholderiales bacterium]
MVESSPGAESPTAILHAAILDNSGYGIIATDTAGVITVFNKTAQRMLGYAETDMVGKQSPACFHLKEEVAERAAAFSEELGIPLTPGFEVFVAKTLRGIPNEHEWTYVRRDGTHFPVLLSVTAMRDTDGQPVGFLGMAVDITARKQSEHLLAESEAQYRLLFQDNPNAMLLYDTDSMQIMAINDAALQLYGYSAHHLIGKHLTELMVRNEHERLVEAVQIARTSTDTIRQSRWLHKRSNGDTMYVETLSKPQTIGNRKARIVQITELTDMVKIENKVADQSQFLKSLINALPVPLFYVDQQGRYLGANPAYLALMDISLLDCLGNTIQQFAPAELARQYLLANEALFATPDLIQHYQMTVNTRTQGPRDINFWKATFRNHEGQVAGLIGMGIDVTEQNRAEQRAQQLNEELEARVLTRTIELASANEELRNAMDQLVQTETVASLGRLVAGVSHELNTPVGNALLTASTLLDTHNRFVADMAKGITKSQLNTFLSTVETGANILVRSLQRAAGLLGDFKQLAVDQTSHQRRTYVLDDVVQEVAVVLSPGLGHKATTLHIDVPPGIDLDGYPGALSHVLINLVDNAATHAFQGRTDATVRIAMTMLDDHQVRLDVQDNGCGIPPQHLNRIFDPFFTTRLGQGGSGLGLHICFNLVTGVLGGKLTVSTLPGNGTTFTLLLPRTAPCPAEDSSAAH